MRKIFVCSPLHAGNGRTVDHNIAFAQELCEIAIKKGGVAPFAPHAFYTTFLNDAEAGDRLLGMICGKEWLAACDEVWVYAPNLDSDVTAGMEDEIDLASQLNIRVNWAPACWKGLQR